MEALQKKVFEVNGVQVTVGMLVLVVVAAIVIWKWKKG